MYTLTNFDRPDSAIAFLRNYWEVILKEKTFSTSTYGNSMHNGLPNINNSNNNPLSAHRNAVVADLYNRLLISKGSTTVSLTSTSGGATGSISNSETDSVTGSQRQEIDIPKCTLALRKPASESSNLSKLDNSVDMDPRVQSTNLVELTNTAAATTTTTTTTATTPTATSTPITAMAIASPTPPPPPTSEMSSSSSSFLGSITNSFSFPTVSSSLNMGKDSIYHRQKMFNNSEGINNNTNNNINNSNNNKSHHNVSTDWNWWPLNLLTCMFSSTPPQRFTMLIAYAILGFLFLSTVHLYHRLALIDLQTGPAVRRSGIIPSHSSLSSPSASSSYSSSSSSELHNLELQLTHLTQLASKMVDGLSHLTSELNSLMTVYSNPEKFSPDQSTLNT
ncbi:unnamed protein product [Trichobilharzia szidati]|nr:unnamed protein product [Trichobilharzia szidati]